MVKIAQRIQAGGWRDPRLLIGIVIVLASTGLGAKVIASSDSTSEYWSVAEGVRAGQTVGDSDVSLVRVHLSSQSREVYMRARDFDLGGNASKVWRRDLPAGSLISVSDLAEADSGSTSQLPLSIDLGAAPLNLARGDIVDVWVGPGQNDTSAGDAEPVLRSVTVLDPGEDMDMASSTRTVLVAVDSDLAPSVVSAISSSHITLIRVQSWTS